MSAVGYGVFDDLDEKTRKSMRTLILRLVAATDMHKHLRIGAKLSALGLKLRHVDSHQYLEHLLEPAERDLLLRCILKMAVRALPTRVATLPLPLSLSHQSHLSTDTADLWRGCCAGSRPPGAQNTPPRQFRGAPHAGILHAGGLAGARGGAGDVDVPTDRRSDDHRAGPVLVL